MKNLVIFLILFVLSFSGHLYSQPGTLDRDFDADGIVIINPETFNYCYSLALQNDGKIIAAGSSGWAFSAFRFNTDGSPDNTFADAGSLPSWIATLAFLDPLFVYILGVNAAAIATAFVASYMNYKIK